MFGSKEIYDIAKTVRFKISIRQLYGWQFLRLRWPSPGNRQHCLN